MRPISEVWAQLKAEGHDMNAVQREIDRVVLRTISRAANQMHAAQLVRDKDEEKPHFHLFGFDVLLSDDEKPWILEVNNAPDMSCDTPIELSIKPQVMDDLFDLMFPECSSDDDESQWVYNPHATCHARFKGFRNLAPVNSMNFG
jgi:hypothetical protein